MSESVLVAGGAGYIGSHAAKILHQRGYRPVVVDNLSRGHRRAVKWGDFKEADLSDSNALAWIMKKYKVKAVMHFAAFAYVGESMSDPALYYQNNVVAALSLLNAMREADCRAFIFSSTCATYGIPASIPIVEENPQNPINPYGWTKLMVEKILDDFDRAYGFSHVNLRYFNAAGADPEGEIGEDHDPETHLIPLVFDAALGKRPNISIFGNDYPTPDGTCIRDYIHVIDLAEAHVLALEHLLGGGDSRSYNMGNNAGYSVLEVIESARKITGREITAVNADRRVGDPPTLVGSSEKIKKELGWKPKYPDLETIIETAWNWHKSKSS